MMAFQDSSYVDVFYYLPPPLNVPGLIFYYSYALTMTIIMLNFMLAIMVDAFSLVKSETAYAPSVPAELVALWKYRVQALQEGADNPFPTESAAAASVHRMARLARLQAANMRNSAQTSYRPDDSVHGKGGEPGTPKGGVARVLASIFPGATSKRGGASNGSSSAHPPAASPHPRRHAPSALRPAPRRLVVGAAAAARAAGRERHDAAPDGGRAGRPDQARGAPAPCAPACSRAPA